MLILVIPYFAITSTYLDPFFPFFEPGAFLNPIGPLIKSSRISPPTTVAGFKGAGFFLIGPGGGGTEVLGGAREAGVPDLLGDGVLSRIGGVSGALGVTACMCGTPGEPTLIGSAVGIGVEGEPAAEVGGGKAVVAGGTD